MSVSFKLRTTKKEGDAYLTARIQAEKLGVNLLVKTPIKVDIAKYTASPKGKVYPAYMSSPEGVCSKVNFPRNGFEKGATKRGCQR